MQNQPVNFPGTKIVEICVSVVKFLRHTDITGLVVSARTSKMKIREIMCSTMLLYIFFLLRQYVSLFSVPLYFLPS